MKSERLGDKAAVKGTMVSAHLTEYSPVFCLSGLGYYEGALRMMKVPGPVRVAETTCQCAGDPECLYELAW